MTELKSSISTWYQNVTFPAFPELAENGETDVVIIGGGLTGILSAYLLAKAGKRVVLLEKRTIASGATGRTTGFLTQSIDTNSVDLLWMLGEEKAKLVIGSHSTAIELIEKIVQYEKIDCEFMRCDNVIFAGAGKEDDAKALVGEQKASRMLGLDAILEPAGSLRLPNAGSLRIKQQAKFHPLKFLAGLAIAAQKAGAVIYEHSEATRLEQSGKGVTVRVGELKIEASWALSASYEPPAEAWGLYFKKAMYVSYVMELSAPKNSLPEMMFEDTENPYHYFRIDATGTRDRIIVGGEDHRLDVPVSKEKNFAALEKCIKKIFLQLSYDVVTRWQGRVLEPIGGRAFIGPYKDDRIWYAFGFSGNGLTYAGIAAMLFSDAVQGKENQYAGVYDSARIPGIKSLLVKGRDFAGEFVHGALKNTFTS